MFSPLSPNFIKRRTRQEKREQLVSPRQRGLQMSCSAPHMWTGESALTEYVKTAGKFP